MGQSLAWQRCLLPSPSHYALCVQCEHLLPPPTWGRRGAQCSGDDRGKIPLLQHIRFSLDGGQVHLFSGEAALQAWPLLQTNIYGISGVPSVYHNPNRQSQDGAQCGQYYKDPQTWIKHCHYLGRGGRGVSPNQGWWRCYRGWMLGHNVWWNLQWHASFDKAVPFGSRITVLSRHS